MYIYIGICYFKDTKQPEGFLYTYCEGGGRGLICKFAVFFNQKSVTVVNQFTQDCYSSGHADGGV